MRYRTFVVGSALGTILLVAGGVANLSEQQNQRNKLPLAQSLYDRGKYSCGAPHPTSIVSGDLDRNGVPDQYSIESTGIPFMSGTFLGSERLYVAQLNGGACVAPAHHREKK